MIAQIKPMMGGGWMATWEHNGFPQKLFVATKERVLQFMTEFLEMGMAVELSN